MTNQQISPTLHARERAELVEFAFVFPLFLLMVGVMSLGGLTTSMKTHSRDARGVVPRRLSNGW
jgi:hypothetical protein